MKVKLLMPLLLLCLSTLADEPKNQLVVWLKDGDKTVYPLSRNPKVTFSEVDLIIETAGIEAVFNLENMKCFTYEYSTDTKCSVVLKNPIATYCSPLGLNFSEVEGMKAYIANSFNPETSTLTLQAVNEVPAGFGVLLVGEQGTYEIPISSGISIPVGENLFKGVTIATEISPVDGDYTNYILVNGSHGTGFYRLSMSGLLDAGKAYLQLPTSVAKNRTISICYDDNTTSLSHVEDKEFDNTYFRLDGVRVMNPSRKGIYMKNGGKIVVK